MTTTKLPPNLRDDYDSPWKEAIEHYFPELIAFFFPTASASIDWTKGYHFLDQELRTIAPEANTGKQVVDKLVQVYLLDGKESWLYIHIEIQGRRELGFPKRMFIYNYRAYDKYDKPIPSFVILADNDPAWRPTLFSYEFAGSKMTLEFETVKLLDFKPRINELLASDNVFGLITAAHLLTQQTKNKVEQRYEAKLLLIQLLLRREWDQARIGELLRVIDWFLRLPKYLRKKLKTEIHNIAEEQKMRYVTSFERDAKEEGLLEGMKKGREVGVLEGIERGKAEGAAQTRLEIAQRLVANGINKQQVAEITGVAVDLL